jgi:uncharacterized protein YraI
MLHRFALSKHPPPSSGRAGPAGATAPRRRRALVALASGALACSGLVLAGSPAVAGVEGSGSAALGKSGGAQTLTAAAVSGSIGAGLSGATKTVRYAGASFRVPASWPVYDLASNPSTCVRFDRHAVYLGTPGVNQNCPARAVGRTEALLVQPSAHLAADSPALAASDSSRLGAAPSLTTATLASGQIVRSYARAGLTVTATFGTRAALARDVLASGYKSGQFDLPRLTPRTRSNSLSDDASLGIASSTTIYSGQGFDTCAAPSEDAMRGWLQSPYRSVGVYIGGINRACGWGNLSKSWLRHVTRMGWRVQPIYVGLQPYCTDQGGMADISTNLATANAEGRQAADDAAVQARALGLAKGSAIYHDTESYDNTISTCVNSTMAFLDGWTNGLHDHGFLSGVYSSAYSAIQNMAQRYNSPTFTRPDIVWFARWDGKSTDQDSVLPAGSWGNYQRVKQYRGDHYETWGGYRINIDSDYLHTAVGTVARVYRVTANENLNVHAGPGTKFRVTGHRWPGERVGILCQVRGQKVGGTVWWDKLQSGRYVTDSYINTPSATGRAPHVPRCSFSYSVLANGGLNKRIGPSTAYPSSGFAPYGALVAVVCQKAGQKIGTTRVWNHLLSGRWVSDYYLQNPAKPGFSPLIPRC